MKLADLLVKPMQRVTKYGLLLKTVLGKTTDEEERLSLLNMVSLNQEFYFLFNYFFSINIFLNSTEFFKGNISF